MVLVYLCVAAALQRDNADVSFLRKSSLLSFSFWPSGKQAEVPFHETVILRMLV